MIAPPRAPHTRPAHDELEALIKEARRRARRRRAAIAAVLLAAVGAGVFFAIGGGGGSTPPGAGSGSGGPAARTSEAEQIQRAAQRATIVEAGITGGVGWAMNGLGLWLTADGGKQWLATLPPHVAAIGDAVARIDEIQFVDPSHGWISASDTIGGIVPPGGASLRHMEIDRTSDGGKTWQWSIPPGCAASCGGAHLSFLNRRDGYALTGVTPEPRLYWTSDGGGTWKQIARPAFSGAIVFLNRQLGFGVSDADRVTGPTMNTPVGGGVFYRTRDGGRHWQTVRLPVPQQYAGQQMLVDPPTFFGTNGVVSVRFRDRRHHSQRVVVYSSHDRGRTWTAHPAPDVPDIRAYGWGMPGATPFSAVSGEAWVLFVGDALYSTSDGGRRWRLVHPTYAPPAPRVRDVRFSSPRRGWAIFDVGNGAALVQTTNGGRDWKPLSPPVPRPKPVHVKPQCGSACQRP